MTVRMRGNLKKCAVRKDFSCPARYQRLLFARPLNGLFQASQIHRFGQMLSETRL
jgi:hypothetical protein